MNRAELRRQAKAEAKKEKTYTLTQAQIDKMKEEVVQEAVDVSFALMLAIPTERLLEYWKKTAPKRIPQFLDDCLDTYEKIGAGTVKLSDLIKKVEEVGKLKMDCLERIKKIRKDGAE
jgi:hypothetical protein